MGLASREPVSAGRICDSQFKDRDKTMVLTPFTNELANKITEWLNNESLRYLISASDVDKSKPFFVSGVEHDDKLIGWVEVFNIENGRCEFGIALPEKKGIGIYIAKQAISQLFQNGFTEIVASVLLDNDVVIRGLKHLGFKLIYITRDKAKFSLNRKEWVK